MQKFSTLTVQYVRFKVTAYNASGVAMNIGSDVVQVAFTLPGINPINADWKTAAWGDTVLGIAQILIGPGTTSVLTVGDYDVYVKITDSPEVPVILVDRVRIV